MSRKPNVLINGITKPIRVELGDEDYESVAIMADENVADIPLITVVMREGRYVKNMVLSPHYQFEGGVGIVTNLTIYGGRATWHSLRSQPVR